MSNDMSNRDFTWIVLEAYTGAMDGCYPEESTAKEIATHLSERHKGTVWLVCAVDAEQRGKMNGDWFPTDKMIWWNVLDRKAA